MNNKRITNADLYGEVKELHVLVKELRYDLEDMKDLNVRIKSLEMFRSYVKGGFAVISSVSVAIFAALKGVFGHF